jgi:hypothetical protein
MCSAEVLFAEDEHAVGDLGAGGEDEPFPYQPLMR